MNSLLLKSTRLFAAFAFCLVSAQADVSLPPLFSEHAVLQKSDKTPIWGKAAPAEEVTVQIAGLESKATADAQGNWQVVLDLHDKDVGPFDLVVHGKNKLTVPDVVIGEVWVCSGQSNMDFTLDGDIEGPQEIAASANPMLRQFFVGKDYGPEPRESCGDHWAVASPQTSGRFSAVAYFFGQTVQKDLKRPVGLLMSAWGGSPIQSWMSYDALQSDAPSKDGNTKAYTTLRDYPKNMEAAINSYIAWQRKYEREDHLVAAPDAFFGDGVDTSAWTPVKLPGKLVDAGLPDAGAIWLRRDLDIPPELAGQALYMEFGNIHDFYTAYFNGTLVDRKTFKSVAASDLSTTHVVVPGSSVKAGKNVVAIRLLNQKGGAGIEGDIKYSPVPDVLSLKIKWPLVFNDGWKAKAEYEFPPIDASAQAEFPAQPRLPSNPYQTPSYLFNAMINPLTRYAIQGVVWYQGETNASPAGAVEYARLLPIMIRDWRQRWGRGDVAFEICQLPNFMGKAPVPTESAWADLREAQAKATALPNTSIAVTIDLGEEGSIHPRAKKEVGERLGKIALAKTYGEKIPYSGPVFDSMTTSGSDIHVKFQHADGGLVAKPLPATYQPRSDLPTIAPLTLPRPKSELQGFAVCGDDHQWKWADAKLDPDALDHDTVIVSSPDVSAPTAVRYAWADNPTCNLYNGAGLPTAPFRTDTSPIASNP